RLRSDDADVKSFAQAVFDLFFKDMDRSLREMGVTDLGVPKKIREMGNVFYGLLTRLNEALDRGERTDVEAVLTRNLFDTGHAAAVAELANYLFAGAAALETQPLETIVRGHIEFAA